MQHTCGVSCTGCIIHVLLQHTCVPNNWYCFIHLYHIYIYIYIHICCCIIHMFYHHTLDASVQEVYGASVLSTVMVTKEYLAIGGGPDSGALISQSVSATERLCWDFAEDACKSMLRTTCKESALARVVGGARYTCIRRSGKRKSVSARQRSRMKASRRSSKGCMSAHHDFHAPGMKKRRGQNNGAV